MKKVLIIFVFLIVNCCLAQNDTTSLNTPAVFSVSFYENKKVLISSNKLTSYDGVYLDIIEQDFLTFRKKYPYNDHPNAISTIRRIALKDIKSLGYATHSREKFCALLGLGIGAVSGAIVTALGNGVDKSDSHYNPGSNRSYATPVLAWAGAGAILGYIIGGTINEYETYDLSKYDDEKKLQEIKRIVKEGLNFKRKE